MRVQLPSAALLEPVGSGFTNDHGTQPEPSVEAGIEDRLHLPHAAGTVRLRAMSPEYSSPSNPNGKKKCHRRGYEIINAVDPNDGRQWEMHLPPSFLEWVTKGHGCTGRTRELANVVLPGLKAPRAIYQGTRATDGVDDDHRVTDDDGGFCYVITPNHAYNYRTGSRVKAHEGEVLLVFADCERVIYDFFWSDADPDDAAKPIHHKTRFRTCRL